MLKINNLKDGDIITVDDDGLMREGTVVRTSPAEHQALVNNGVQEFWYDQEDMHAVPLDETPADPTWIYRRGPGWRREVQKGFVPGTFARKGRFFKN